MKRILLIALPLLLLLQGCDEKNETTLKGHKIDKPIRDAVHVRNTELLKALKGGHSLEAVKDYLSDDLIDKLSDADDSLILQSGRNIASVKYKILDEYYTQVVATHKEVRFDNDARKGNEYTIKYLPLTKESFTTLLVVPIDSAHNMLLTLIYGKYNDNWLVNIIRFGTYNYSGKTLRDLYKAAQQNFKDSNFIDAHINTELALSCLSAADQVLTYKCDDAIQKFSKKENEMAKTKYHFPITMVMIASHPEIIGVAPQEVTDDGYFPMITYKSTIPLSDTKGIKAEYQLVKKYIGTIFKGVNENKKCVIYRCYNEKPTDDKDFEHFTILNYLPAKGSVQDEDDYRFITPEK